MLPDAVLTAVPHEEDGRCTRSGIGRWVYQGGVYPGNMVGIYQGVPSYPGIAQGVLSYPGIAQGVPYPACYGCTVPGMLWVYRTQWCTDLRVYRTQWCTDLRVYLSPKVGFFLVLSLFPHGWEVFYSLGCLRFIRSFSGI